MKPDSLHQPNHNGHLLIEALRRHADTPVLSCQLTSRTGGQLSDEISRYIQASESLGAGSNSSVAVLARNRPEVLIDIAAMHIRGYRRVALHPLGSLDDHAYILEDAGVTTLLIEPTPIYVQRALTLIDRVESLRQILTFGPVPSELSNVATDIVAHAALFRSEPLVAASLPPRHVTSLVYTGGTTGCPKGVQLTAQSYFTMTTIQLAEWEWPDRPQFLSCTPLSHAGAAFVTPVMVKGGTLFLLPKFDVADVLETIEKKRITAMMLVPSMIYALLDHPDLRARDVSSLETIYYGASAINPTRLDEAIDRFGPKFAQFYGQSEAPMAITYLPMDKHQGRRRTSCGRPTQFSRCAILGEDGEPVRQGEVGEICVRGPLLSDGYWNQPQITQDTFRDGWLHTGDLAHEDQDGYWYIVDRIKDMIVTGGFNVFPREVEDVVSEHPAVEQVCVVGTPDDKWGEAVTAVIVLRSSAHRDDGFINVLTSEIQAAVRDRKGPVHSPKRVVVMDAIPLTGLGKPDKKAIRRVLESATPAKQFANNAPCER
ncbi:fatty-acid--CoA ligase FadD8 [Mycobacterium intracellulare]|uniref:fatty-acid--CoA ligase FadD8 n=1 Tax=Mycobacterium intracellulare TaxID=1767 RepID=UPI0019152155|nr:fatty-acid--CoA ligase FadD8 [Mycobacterium intracellulare]MCA2356958.1 AMP-binding protein [Mycobacterium intracellulare]MCA2365381.1 AMP-binding protein [Mycobacterium intracellulare]